VLPGGATLFEGGTGRAWVLIDDGDSAGLGPALVWAGRHRAKVLEVLVDDGPAPPGAVPGSPTPAPPTPASGVIARRAAEWSAPPTIWRVEGHDLVLADPVRPPAPAPLPPDALRFAELLRSHGADPVVEHGVLRGEVLGLEVARVVARDRGWHLEVGVGRLDRSARAEMRPDEPDATAVDEVVGVVRTWRRSSAPRHPANMLSRERWLRAALVAHPALVAAVELHAVAPPLPRPGLRQGAAAPAVGVAADGSPMIVVCSTGVDVDLVPTAADVRSLRDGPGASTRLVLAVPQGDDYQVTRSLGAALRHPAEVVTVRRDWAALTDA
jgi:hypothetical protein